MDTKIKNFDSNKLNDFQKWVCFFIYFKKLRQKMTKIFFLKLIHNINEETNDTILFRQPNEAS